MIQSLLLAALVSAGPSPDGGDVVELEDGSRLEGRVLFEDEQTVVLRVGSELHEILRRDVAEIRSLPRSLALFLDRLEQTPRDDVAALGDLARFCAGRGLEGEAALCWWLILLREPDDAEANRALGGRERGGGWVLADGRRWFHFDDLRGRHRSWKDAWEIPITHYLLRTDLELEEAILLAIDLERFYRAFLELYGATLRIFEIEEPMETHVHGHPGSYVPTSTGRAGRFEPLTRRLVMNAADGIERGLLVHEATHQLVHAITRRGETGPTLVPAWVDEGWADYVEAGARGRPGELTLTDGAKHDYHFLVHARADKPFSLSRVTTFQPSDFERRDATLPYAQAYTLVHYLMQGEGGRFRDRFESYLRATHRGRPASRTHLLEALGIGEKDLEGSWKRFVDRVAGGR